MKWIVRSVFAVALFTLVPAIAGQPQADSDTKLESALDRSGERVTITHLPNGTVKIELHDTFQHVALARTGEDGQIETLCAEHADHARQFLNGDSLEARITVGESQ